MASVIPFQFNTIQCGNRFSSTSLSSRKFLLNFDRNVQHALASPRRAQGMPSSFHLRNSPLVQFTNERIGNSFRTFHFSVRKEIEKKTITCSDLFKISVVLVALVSVVLISDQSGCRDSLMEPFQRLRNWAQGFVNSCSESLAESACEWLTHEKAKTKIKSIIVPQIPALRNLVIHEILHNPEVLKEAESWAKQIALTAAQDPEVMNQISKLFAEAIQSDEVSNSIATASKNLLEDPKVISEVLDFFKNSLDALNIPQEVSKLASSCLEEMSTDESVQSAVHSFVWQILKPTISLWPSKWSFNPFQLIPSSSILPIQFSRDKKMDKGKDLDNKSGSSLMSLESSHLQNNDQNKISILTNST